MNQPADVGRSSFNTGEGGISSTGFSDLDLSPIRKLLRLNQPPVLDSLRALSLSFSLSLALSFSCGAVVDSGGIGGTGGMVDGSSGMAKDGTEAEWRGDRGESGYISRSDLSPIAGIAVVGRP